MRVGPLRRIDKALLRQSLHCSDAKGQAGAAAELREMLREACDPREAAVLRAELDLAEKGGWGQRWWALRVVGQYLGTPAG